MGDSFQNCGSAIKSGPITGNVTSTSTNIFFITTQRNNLIEDLTSHFRNFNSWLGSLFNQSKRNGTRVVKKPQLEASTSHISFSFEWKIENFKICRLKPCVKLLSPTFHVHHHQMESDWQFIIYPNGDSKTNPNFLSIYLLLKRSKQQMQMVCKFTISLNASIEEHFTKTLADGTSEGNSRFILTSHPQIQTKDLNVKCVLNLFSSDLESSTSLNEKKSELDQIALTILSGECNNTFTWNFYNFHKDVDPATFKTQFDTLFEGTTLKWQLKLVYIYNRGDVNPALQLLSYHKINEIPPFTLTFTIIDSEMTVIRSRSLEPQDFSMNSRAEPTGFVNRNELYDAKNFSIICVLRCPVNYVTEQGYPSTLKTTFDRNEIDSRNVGTSMVPSLSFKPVIQTIIWTIKNARKNSSRDIKSPDIFLEQPKSQWRIVLLHSVDNMRTDIRMKQIMKIIIKVENGASFNPKMTFQIGIGDQFFDKLYDPSFTWDQPFYLPLNDPLIVNDDWTICCKFNLSIVTDLPDDIVPIEFRQHITSILN